MRQMLSALTALLVFSGCAVGGEVPGELSEHQIELLADEIVRRTPEHTHFAEGTTFAWVLFEPPDQDRIPGLTTAVSTRLQERYTVYRAKDDVPSDRLQVDRGGELIGYRDGFSFGFTAKVVGDDRVEIRYSDWEGNLAASWQTIWYTWTGTQWEVTKRGPMIVS